jgi:hypothetical protein
MFSIQLLVCRECQSSILLAPLPIIIIQRTPEFCSPKENKFTNVLAAKSDIAQKPGVKKILCYELTISKQSKWSQLRKISLMY